MGSAERVFFRLKIASAVNALRALERSVAVAGLGLRKHKIVARFVVRDRLREAAERTRPNLDAREVLLEALDRILQIARDFGPPELLFCHVDLRRLELLNSPRRLLL